MGLSELIFLLSILNASWFIAMVIAHPSKISVSGYYKGDWCSAIKDAVYWANHRNSVCKKIDLPEGIYFSDDYTFLTMLKYNNYFFYNN